MTPLVPLQADFGTLVDGLLAKLPETLYALLVRALGGALACVLAGRVRQLSARVGAGDAVAGTALGSAAGAAAVDRSLGYLVIGYVLLLTLRLATSIAGFPVPRSFVTGLFDYAPFLVAGVLVLLVGAVVAEFAGRTVADSAVLDGFGPLFGALTKALVCIAVATIALDTARLDTGIVRTFAASLAQGLVIAVALALGLAFGLGGREYVAENIEDWSAPADGWASAGEDGDPGAGAGTGTGTASGSGGGGGTGSGGADPGD